MKNKNKVIILVSIIALVLIATLSLTYAAMSFNQTGGNSDLVLGDIYMHYNETKALTIEDAMPGSPFTNYFEFTISGKNTYTKNDIYYDFLLTRGDLPSGKTEDNRIPDKYLKFKLVSVDGQVETVLFEDETYPDLNNKRIYVETIAKNTTEEINRTYRLYATIDYNLEIGTSNTAVFTIEEWENAFASIKVNVTGDFTEKEVNPYNDCFETTTLEDGTLEITNYYVYDTNSSDELYKNPLCTTDVVIPSSIKGATVTSIGARAFENKGIKTVELPETLISIGDYAFNKNYIRNVTIPNSVTTLGNEILTNNFGDYYGFYINIGSGITYIKGIIASSGHGSMIVVNINKTCEEMEQIDISPENSSSAYPWDSTTISDVSYILTGTDGTCYSADETGVGGGVGGGPSD